MKTRLLKKSKKLKKLRSKIKITRHLLLFEVRHEIFRIPFTKHRFYKYKFFLDEKSAKDYYKFLITKKL